MNTVKLSGVRIVNDLFGDDDDCCELPFVVVDQRVHEHEMAVLEAFAGFGGRD